MNMNRRAFLMNSGILFAGLVATRGAKAAPLCTGDANTPLEGQISHNHGHRLLIPRSDVAAGRDKSYDIQGASNHGHIVIVTQELFAQLQSAGRITIESSDEAGHSHSVTLVCA